MKEYTYTKNSTVDGSWAIIVLPEIFGLNGFIRNTVDSLAAQHGVLVKAIDHFYPFTKQVRTYDYIADREAAHSDMSKVTGPEFMEFFSKELNTIQKDYPSIKTFAVVGYCFGGRLAFLTGIDMRVTKIISYYGSRPHIVFYTGKSALEALVQTRAHDVTLSVLAFYGGKDESIPESDREQTKKALADALIPYREAVYLNAGHAFCNSERADRFDSLACRSSLEKLNSFLKTA